MSYADMAAKGPRQTNAEKVPDAVPEIAHSDSGVHSISTISSSSESDFPSYADQQLAHERAEEARKEARQEAKYVAHETKQQADEFSRRAESELSRLDKEAGKKYDQFSSEAKAMYDETKKQASKDYEKVKKEASKDYEKVKKEASKGAEKAEVEGKKAGQWAEDNKDNPVVIGNAIVLTALGGLLGIGAYRLHQRNELTWKVAGAWAGIVGLFAVGDYYVSHYFFKKYPPKQ